MIFQFRIEAEGSELHGETFEIQDQSRDRADTRAAARVVDTFSWSSRRDARAVFVAQYASRQAMRRAEESGVSLTTSCKRHDFSDGDVCSKCDAMRGVA